MLSQLARHTLRSPLRSQVPRVALCRNFSYNPMVAPEAKVRHETDKWLEDKGAWPVLFFMGCAGAFATCFMLFSLFCSPDVRISKSNRAKLIRDWEMKRN